MKITRNSKQVTIDAEYNKVFSDSARRLGGKWNESQWVFDIRDEHAVLNLCYRAYGDDGVRKNQCDVRVTIPELYSEWQAPISFFGYSVARAYGRDSGVKIRPGIVIESGDFRSGGSIKNWRTVAEDNTVFVIRDVSRELVEEFNEDYATIEILETTKPYTLEELRKEKQVLEDRLAEIDTLLSTGGAQ